MFVCTRNCAVLCSLPYRNPIRMHCGIVSDGEQGNVCANVMEDYEEIVGHKSGTCGTTQYVRHSECMAKIG